MYILECKKKVPLGYTYDTTTQAVNNTLQTIIAANDNLWWWYKCSSGSSVQVENWLSILLREVTISTTFVGSFCLSGMLKIWCWIMRRRLFNAFGYSMLYRKYEPTRWIKTVPKTGRLHIGSCSTITCIVLPSLVWHTTRNGLLTPTLLPTSPRSSEFCTVENNNDQDELTR